MQTSQAQEVFIVDGLRTPFLKAKRGLGPFTASDLAVQAGRPLLNRLPCSTDAIDEVIIGSAMPAADEANIARVIGLRLGINQQSPAWTVMRNCASGLQAVDNAYQSIAMGRSEVVLAGGTDAMSHAPLLFNQKMANWLSLWFSEKKMVNKLGLLTRLRPQFLVPVIALLRGLTDPIAGINMGQTAENVAFRFDISREAMDEYALRSHRLASAAKTFLENQIVPIIDNRGNVYDHDNGVREDSELDKLARLKPMFDKRYGKVTAGNSSQITDGAALLVLASKAAVDKYHLPVVAQIVDVNWAGLAPDVMGLGPIHAMTPLLNRYHIGLEALECVEINEAFAAQVLGCIAAWEDQDYCQQQLGLAGAMGKLDIEKLNVNGGAIACGHPIGASGARVVLNLARNLQHSAKPGACGLASLCIGGGQGGAIMLKNCQGALA